MKPARTSASTSEWSRQLLEVIFMKEVRQAIAPCATLAICCVTPHPPPWYPSWPVGIVSTLVVDHLIRPAHGLRQTVGPRQVTAPVRGGFHSGFLVGRFQLLENRLYGHLARDFAGGGSTHPIAHDEQPWSSRET